ncbi:helix-turn-helix domain-containing protein [Cohnella cholangitidis]|uniref:Helix-turn-helix domain-containing protein n=1 Tax=Cohnella cholangitidis TaxID=2598458 RepID=A0A7G5C0K8_9BACL|nr:helix-turn-helix domain-containing protein [Cohnella cholangitidis]QMV42742.1 helix-turn-helix domain-containing protein [Cohnella cholangitidis]
MDNDILKLVGQRIRSLRKEREMSQELLGEKGGFHYSYIGQIERGEKNISLLNLSKIATALDVSLSQLFTYIDEEEKRTESEKDLQEIVSTLRYQKPGQVRMVRNVVREILGENEKYSTDK